uniref:TolC family protein n=1 Tax=Comamonas sp. UBA7840 TaxID=1946392 RepID=UPI00257AF016
RQAQAQAGVARADRLPSLSVSGGYTGVRLPESMVGEELGGRYMGSGQVAFDFSYGVDLWGGKRASWEAAVDTVHAAAVDAQAARLKLVSGIVQAYVELDRAWRANDIAEQELERARKTVQLVRQRRAAGIDSDLQVRQAEARIPTAQQQLQAAERMHEAAAAGGELARRMALVGNFSKREQAQELRVQHDAAAQLARARLNAALEREQLARLMGLWGPQADFALPDSLPPLPKAEALHTGADAEATALRERLDVRALRRELDTTADRHGFARVGALFGDIGASYSRNTTTDRATRHDEVTRGWELELPLPLFDWGGVAAAGARAQLQHSSAQLRNAALQARSETRTSWLRYRTAWDLAQQQRSEVLPLAQQMQEEAVYRYNGMFISTWQLLAQARATTQAVATATEAQRDFWLADVDLQLALYSTSPGAGAASLSSPATPSDSPAQGH